MEGRGPGEWGGPELGLGAPGGVKPKRGGGGNVWAFREGDLRVAYGESVGVRW